MCYREALPVKSDNMTNMSHNLKQCEIRRKLILFTNRKSHTGFYFSWYKMSDLE